jgi:hypothetical protein
MYKKITQQQFNKHYCGMVLWNKPVSLPAYDLTGIKLPHNLEEAKLRGADLRGANLQGANLRGANLTGTGVSLLHNCGKYKLIIINNNGVIHAGCFRGSVEEFKTAVVQKYGTLGDYHPELETFLNSTKARE